MMFANNLRSGEAEPPAPLNDHRSRDHEEILNVIDQLRSEGISRYVDLPQLIVCGDQSSGKSSVLEAISGLDFPAKDNVCTRFATELILRRSPVPGIKISIHPDPDRPEKEQNRLRIFEPIDLALDNFAELVQSAGNAMRVGENDLPFSKDILRVEISGPTQPHLTLVDLPGLYHAPDEQQDLEGIVCVESLVRSYMVNPRSVMLAIISAKSDVALQKVTAFTREVDPQGTRTLGIITKPDTLPHGSELERSFYLLSQNKRVVFRLGWHVLKNRTYEEQAFSLTARHDSEARFLSQGIWRSLPRGQAGISTLLPRLSNVLKDHILSQMPGFIADTQISFQDTKQSLLKLGTARGSLAEQRRYLLQGSQRFSALMNNSLNGIYLDPFFGDALQEDCYRKRLRAVVQERLCHFSDMMKVRGEYTQIIDDGVECDNKRAWKYRTDFVEEVRKRMRRSRGKELPGNFNSFIVGELFYLQTRPWKDIVGQCVEALLSDIRTATMSLLNEALDRHTVSGLLKHVVNGELLEIETNLRTKTMELLRPQQSGHPITYNSQYVDIIQETRDQHLRDSITKKLKTFFGDDYPEDPQSRQQHYFRMQGLIDSISSRTETDMERFACSEAIDCMQAYYQVALKKFVDDFSNLAVEKCLLEPLADTFSHTTVDRMTDAVVEDIASEDEDIAIERKQLEHKLEVLNNSLRRLQQLDQYSNTFGLHTESEPVEEENYQALSERDSSLVSVAAPSDSIIAPNLETMSTPSLDERDEQVVEAQLPTFRRTKHRKSSLFE